MALLNDRFWGLLSRLPVLDTQTEEPWVVLRSTRSSSFWIVEPTSLPFLSLQILGLTTKSAVGDYQASL
jgi:hypothetical protein